MKKLDLIRETMDTWKAGKIDQDTAIAKIMFLCLPDAVIQDTISQIKTTERISESEKQREIKEILDATNAKLPTPDKGPVF